MGGKRLYKLGTLRIYRSSHTETSGWGWSTPHVPVENWGRDTSAAKVPLKSEGSQARTRLPSLEHRCREEAPGSSCSENQQGLHPRETDGSRDSGILLKGPSTRSLTRTHLPQTPAKGQHLKKTRDIQGGIELFGCTVKAGGVAPSRLK